MIPVEETVASTRTAHGLGVAALGLAIAMPVVAVAGWVWAAATPGAEALGVAFLALVAVAVVAVLAIAVGVVSLVVSRPNSLAKVALVLVGASAVVLTLMIYPPTLWFG